MMYNGNTGMSAASTVAAKSLTALHWRSGIGAGGYGTIGSTPGSGGNGLVVITYTPVPVTGIYTCAGQPDGVTTLTTWAGTSTYTASCFNGAALLAKIDGRLNNWFYDSSLWTDTTTVNPTSYDLDVTEAKLDAFN